MYVKCFDDLGIIIKQKNTTKVVKINTEPLYIILLCCYDFKFWAAQKSSGDLASGKKNQVKSKTLYTWLCNCK